MPTHSVSFENEEGQCLAGRLELPAGPPQGYALFAHCFTCSKDLRSVRTISHALCDRGFAVLRFDFTGLGESAGAFADTTFSSNAGDLLAAARYLREEHEAPAILIGHSLGGAAVLQVASEIDEVRAVATIGAPAEPEHVTHLLEDSIDEIEQQGEARVRLAGRGFTIRKQFLDDLAEHNMQARIRELGRPLLIFHSPVDQIVGIDNAAHIYRAARHPKSFISLDEADHLLMDAADAEYVAHVLSAWATRYLDEVPSTDGQQLGEGHVEARTRQQGFRTEILASGHSLVADEPERLGGTNTGPTPYDLLAAALGSCTSMTLRVYAERKGWPLEESIVQVKHSKFHAEDCAQCETEEGKIDRLERTITLVGPLDEEQRERLLEIAQRCPVHRTLHHEIDLPAAQTEPETA